MQYGKPGLGGLMIAELLRQINRGREFYSRKGSRFGDRSYRISATEGSDFVRDLLSSSLSAA